MFEALVIGAPDQPQQLFARENSAFVPRQLVEKKHRLTVEVEAPAGERRDARSRVEEENAAADGGVIASVLAQRGLDAGEEDGSVEALGQIVGRPMLKSADLVTNSLPGTGEDQHRAWRPWRPFAHQIEHLDGVHIGQLEVKDGQIGQLLA